MVTIPDGTLIITARRLSPLSSDQAALDRVVRAAGLEAATSENVLAGALAANSSETPNWGFADVHLAKRKKDLEDEDETDDEEEEDEELDEDEDVDEDEDEDEEFEEDEDFEEEFEDDELDDDDDIFYDDDDEE